MSVAQIGPPETGRTREANEMRGTEAALLVAFRRGDASAAEALLERYGDALYTLAWRVTGAPEAAAEAVQEAMRAIESADGEAEFGPWIRRRTARAAYRRVRAEAAAPPIAIDDVLPPIDDDGHFEPLDDWSRQVGVPAADSRLAPLVRAAIDALPPEDRTALVLSDVEGMDRRDVAAVLDIDEAAVMRRVHAARLFVRARLARGLTPPGMEAAR